MTPTEQLANALPKDPAKDSPEQAETRAQLESGHLTRVQVVLHDGTELAIVLDEGRRTYDETAQRLSLALRHPEHALSLNGQVDSLVVPVQNIRFIHVEPRAGS